MKYLNTSLSYRNDAWQRNEKFRAGEENVGYKRFEMVIGMFW